MELRFEFGFASISWSIYIYWYSAFPFPLKKRYKCVDWMITIANTKCNVICVKSLSQCQVHRGYSQSCSAYWTDVNLLSLGYKHHRGTQEHIWLTLDMDFEKWNFDSTIWQLYDKGRNTAQVWSHLEGHPWGCGNPKSETSAGMRMSKESASRCTTHPCGSSWEKTGAQKYSKLKQQRLHGSVHQAVDQGN